MPISEVKAGVVKVVKLLPDKPLTFITHGRRIAGVQLPLSLLIKSKSQAHTPIAFSTKQLLTPRCHLKNRQLHA
jgi:hypothetical protein